MTREGQHPHRSPDALAPATRRPARATRASGRDNRAAWRLVGLAVLGHMLRSRRFYERVAFSAIVLAALSGLSQENRTRTFARLAAWNQRQVQHLERKAEREAGRLGRQVKRLEHAAKGTTAQSE